MRCEKLSPGNFSLHAEGRALDWHLDHVHIELNWPGARRRTSFWRSPLAR